MVSIDPESTKNSAIRSHFVLGALGSHRKNICSTFKTLNEPDKYKVTIGDPGNHNNSNNTMQITQFLREHVYAVEKLTMCAVFIKGR